MRAVQNVSSLKGAPHCTVRVRVRLVYIEVEELTSLIFWHSNFTYYQRASKHCLPLGVGKRVKSHYLSILLYKSSGQKGPQQIEGREGDLDLKNAPI